MKKLILTLLVVIVAGVIICKDSIYNAVVFEPALNKAAKIAAKYGMPEEDFKMRAHMIGEFSTDEQAIKEMVRTDQEEDDPDIVQHFNEALKRQGLKPLATH